MRYTYGIFEQYNFHFSESKNDEDLIKINKGDFFEFCQNELAVKTEECNTMKLTNRKLREVLLKIKKVFFKLNNIIITNRYIDFLL